MTDEVKKKPVAKKAPAKTVEAGEPKSAATRTIATDDMIKTVGRRKCAIARVRLMAGEQGILVNGKDYTEYFPVFQYQKIVSQALSLVDMSGRFGVSVKVVGGGVRGQAEAIRHGIARAIVAHDPELKKTMRSEGFITRDPRVKERKKPGLKSARRAPQFSKR